MTTNCIMSFILDKILDSVGLDDETRQRRTMCQKAAELLDTWKLNVSDIQADLLYVGSNYETTTVDGLSSDIDILCVYPDCRVIHDIKQWIPGDTRFTYMIDETDCYKSFVKLCLLSPHYPGPFFDGMVSELPKNHTVDVNGNLLLSSRETIGTLMNRGLVLETHGPAQKVPGTEPLQADFVVAFRCDFFPCSALRWKERQTPESLYRVGESIITEANHCYVVPVGNKLSPNQSIEWRYSFSHIERNLVYLWNNTQYKLYIFMKFILKDLIEPRIPDVLSSYHIKTIMLWMNEEYSRDFFTKSNITSCLLRYLTNLLDTVRRRSLPHYFINECNLYYNKMDDRTSQELSNIIQRIIDKFPYSLFDIERRCLGSILHHVLSDKLVLQTVHDVSQIQRQEWLSIDIVDNLGIVSFQLESLKNTLSGLTMQSQLVLQKLHDMLNKYEKEDSELTNIVDFSQKDLACNYSVEFLIKNGIFSNVPDIESIISAVTNVQRCVNNCRINTRLKVAAFLVFTGDFRGGSILLDRIERQIKPYTYFICCHDTCMKTLPRAQNTVVYDNKSTMTEFLKYNTTGTVEYNSEMIRHLPRSLVYEVFRCTVVSPPVSNVYDDFKWHQHVILHCPVFMYFLRYVIAKTKGLYTESKAAIANMERTSKQPRIVTTSHSETNHNVIGHCHMELGDTQRAYREYRESLNVKKFDNAVIWHMAVLLRRQIRGNQ